MSPDDKTCFFENLHSPNKELFQDSYQELPSDSSWIQLRAPKISSPFLYKSGEIHDINMAKKTPFDSFQSLNPSLQKSPKKWFIVHGWTTPPSSQWLKEKRIAYKTSLWCFLCSLTTTWENNPT